MDYPALTCFVLLRLRTQPPATDTSPGTTDDDQAKNRATPVLLLDDGGLVFEPDYFETYPRLRVVRRSLQLSSSKYYFIVLLLLQLTWTWSKPW